MISGLTGFGGGILVVPLLALGFGIGQRVGQGASLIPLLPTAAVGALTHHRNGNVDVRAAPWMAVAGVPAALVGSALAMWLPARALGDLRGLPADRGDADVGRGEGSRAPAANPQKCQQTEAPGSALQAAPVTGRKR